MDSFGGDSSQPCVCIGSKLRLISQLKVRYEGTLYSVDTAKSTISLRNVRTFGTEGRAGSEASEVPGSDEVFEIIVFRAADISEIFMIEAPTAVNVDPAIVNANAGMGGSNQRDFSGGLNVNSVDSRNSTPGPESIQSGDVHHVPRQDMNSKAINKGWGVENRGNDREHRNDAWGQHNRQFDRRGPNDGRRDQRESYESNGPYSAGRKTQVNNNMNNRSYQNRNAGYGYGNNDRQMSAGRPNYYGDNNNGRGGWQRAPGRGYNNRDMEDRNVPQHRRQQQQHGGPSGRGRGFPQQRRDGGQRSRDRETRDPQVQKLQLSDFDFEKANEEFTKLALNQGEKDDGATGSENENKDSGAEDGKNGEATYQRDAFFDEISRDSRQAQRPKTSERSLNMQTFGAAATRRRPTTGRYYNRRPGNWANNGGANNGDVSTNGTAQVSA